jgi:hypothetical protein
VFVPITEDFMFRGFFLVLLCLLLSGCYLISEPIFDKGAYAPIAGEFVCQGMMGPKNERFVEKKSGIVFPNYTYESTSDGSEMVFSKMQGTMYAVQITPRDRKLVVAFADFLDARKMLLLVPDLMSKGPYIEQLATKMNVRATGGGEPGSVRLLGNKDAIAAFVIAHDKSILSVVMECNRRT